MPDSVQFLRLHAAGIIKHPVFSGNTAVKNQHIIRILPASEDIAGYLNIFLASDYGKALITRFTYGSVVDEIDDNHIRQIAIPLLKNHTVQKKINDLALEANEKRYQAYLLEQEALQIMDRDVIYAKK